MRRGLISISAVTAASVLMPAAALGHAIGQVFTLPVPLVLYLAGAALAVAASFVVSVVVVRPAGAEPRYPVVPVAPGLGRATSVVLLVLGLVWWYGTILAGYVVDPGSPLPAVLFWIGVWVGLPLSAVFLGNPWPSLSLFRSTFGALEWLGRRMGLQRLDFGVAYPAGLGRWPAVVFLFTALWCELILPGKVEPGTVATLLLAYTLLTVLGMLVFGRVAWLRDAELFEVLLGWLGRIGPIGRRVVEPTVCEGCTEACDPNRCVDCPECATAADPGERRAELRPWFAGLTEVRRVGWTDAAFIVLALAGVTFDGLKETVLWGSIGSFLFPAASGVFGALDSVLAVQTVGLLGTWLAFLTAFSLAAWLTRALHDAAHDPPRMGAMAGVYASTLLPIAGGYLIAHYLTLLVQGIVWLPGLLADPLDTAAPPLDWMPVSGVWYLSVGAIVLGHIVAVVLAHRIALRDSPSRPVLAGLPLVVLMIGYTVLSLWIIAAPITLEPGVAPAAFRLR
ncbi:MAG TPA: hypothetical protein VIA82_09970 [Candidatus Limnocylindria bacterium]